MNFTYKARAEDRRRGSIESGAMNALVFLQYSATVPCGMQK